MTELVDENTERIGELNLFIEQRENRITTLRNQISELLDHEPRPNNLIRTVASLVLSLSVCVCNFYLIDETLRPLFPNRLIAVGIFLAGMFNLFSRTSFLYEEGARLSVRRVLAENGSTAGRIGVRAGAGASNAVDRAGNSLICFCFFSVLSGRKSVFE